MTTRIATYALDQPIPYLLQRGVIQTLSGTVRYGASGDVVVIDSATVTITQPDGIDLVAAAVAPIVAGVATYDLTPDAAATIGDGWIVSWTPTIGGVVYQPLRASAVMADYIPPASVAVTDLYTEMPELAARIPQAQGSRGSNVGWQPQIDQAYYALIRRLLSDGRPIWRIVGATGLHEWLLIRSLQACVQAISHGPDSDWAQAAKELHYRLRQAERGMKVRYDDDDVSIRHGMAPIIRLAPVGRPVW